MFLLMLLHWKGCLTAYAKELGSLLDNWTNFGIPDTRSHRTFHPWICVHLSR